jgi:hypothetical protein
MCFSERASQKKERHRVFTQVELENEVSHQLALRGGAPFMSTQSFLSSNQITTDGTVAGRPLRVLVRRTPLDRRHPYFVEVADPASGLSFGVGDGGVSLHEAMGRYDFSAVVAALADPI